jgi:hypothetical protein
MLVPPFAVGWNLPATLRTESGSGPWFAQVFGAGLAPAVAESDIVGGAIILDDHRVIHAAGVVHKLHGGFPVDFFRRKMQSRTTTAASSRVSIVLDA